MKDEIRLKLEDAHAVLDMICSYKYFLEVRIEAAASKSSKQKLLDRWEAVEAFRMKLLKEVKKAEGQKL